MRLKADCSLPSPKRVSHIDTPATLFPSARIPIAPLYLGSLNRIDLVLFIRFYFAGLDGVSGCFSSTTSYLRPGRLYSKSLEMLEGADIKFTRSHRLDVALVQNHPIAL
jgi:hypothetical protein